MASTRLRDAACWPKVWLFARKLLTMHPDEAIGGAVPVRWNADMARWTAGNRHRPVAHLLIGRPLRVTAKSKQVVSWAEEDDGVKTPRKLAHLVADPAAEQ
uniref:Uncharacterized protein n=1 Tax=Pyramimonas obovata TaxID=1411642 RepID=A0A7S0WMS1_9CHLO